jgi:hypothetical protein
MYRLLVYLPLCFLLAPEPVEVPPAAEQPAAQGSGTAAEPLPAKDPVAQLGECLERYNQEHVNGYSLIMHKQERIGGVLQPSEDVQVHYQAKPHSVFMHWLNGARLADSVVYVEGANNGQMLVHPAGIAGRLVKVVTRDPEGEEAKQSGRYPITQFGIKEMLSRSVKSWQAAKDSGNCRIEYLGVRKLREAGERLCYVLRRTCNPPDPDGVAEITIYLDKETCFEIGTVLKDAEGKLLGEYIYRDINLNPTFKKNQFEASALTQP